MGAIAVTFAFPLLQAGIVELGERRRRKRLELEQKIRTFLVASLVYCARQGGVDWEKTGIQAFIVCGFWKWQRQERLAKVRLGAIPSSGIRWKKSKGMIGRCWETRGVQYADLDVHFAPYATFTRSQWEMLSTETRYGLTFDDYQTLKGKYGVVAAVPIVNKQDKYIGCITADTPPLTPGVVPPVRAQVLGSLATTAGLVAEVL